MDNINAKEPHRVQGENNGMAQLTNDQVREIRKKFKKGDTPKENYKIMTDLGIEYGVNPNIIKLIVTGKTWRSVV